jgi:hypothetical protein
MLTAATDAVSRLTSAIRAEIWLPAATLVAGVIGVFALAEPNELGDQFSEGNRIGSAWGAVVRADAAQLAAVFVAVLAVSIVLQPFSNALAEGLASMPATPLGRALSSPMLRMQVARWKQLKRAAYSGSLADPDGPDMGSPRARLLLRRYPLDEDEIRPTLLGNALYSAESRVGEHYKFSWPALGGLLLAVLREQGHDPTAGPRCQIELFTGLIAASGATALVGIGLMADEPGAWRLLPAALAIAAYGFYRVAVRATASYALSLDLAVELHRFDLLHALHLPLPDDGRAERERFLELSRNGGHMDDARYSHDHSIVADPAERPDASPDRSSPTTSGDRGAPGHGA